MYSDYYSIQYRFDESNLPKPKLPSWLELPKAVLPKNKPLFIPSDFLMLAEGSEVEGPIPRLVIPKKGNGDFNLDHFSVCLMSTDMQTQNGLLNFCMKGDAQLMMSQNDHGLFAFVQHFTLHDTMARGFVRPFCLAYLSQDRNKLIHYYDRLSSEFGRVVSHYKIGNFLTFFRDTLHILSDLQYTREKHVESMETGVSIMYDEEDPTAAPTTFQTTPLPRAPGTAPSPTKSCSGIEERRSTTTLTSEKSPDDNDLKTSNSPLSSDVKEETSVVVNGGGVMGSKVDDDLERGGVGGVEVERSKDFAPLKVAEMEVADGSAPLAPSKFAKDPEIQLKEFDDAIREVKEILTMVSNLLEKHHVEVKEQFNSKRNPGPRETPLDSGNFDMAQLLDAPNHSHQGSLNCVEPSWVRWTYAEDSYQPKLRRSLRVKIQKKLRDFELLVQPTFDDYELLQCLYRYFSRSHLTLSTELDDIKDLDPPVGLLTIGRIVYLNFLANFESRRGVDDGTSRDVDEKVESPVDLMVREWVADESRVDFMACSSHGTSNAEVGRLHESLGGEGPSPRSTTITTTVSECINNHNNNSPNATGNSKPRNVEQPSLSRPTCLDLRVEGRTSPRKSRPGERTSMVSFADHISNFTQSKRIGSGILKVFQSYPSQVSDMIYSLLIGRLLIIHTSLPTNEAEVRDIITALWFFVPGHRSVWPWVTWSLTTEDMARLKLVGMLRKEEGLVPHSSQVVALLTPLHQSWPSSSSSPPPPPTSSSSSSSSCMIVYIYGSPPTSPLQTSASFFDVTRKKFVGPSYKAGLLLEMTEKRLSYLDEASFLAYLHSILFHLVNKAFLYFHGFCMTDRNVDTPVLSAWQTRMMNYDRSASFCKSKLKISEYDASIVMYLARVVKNQVDGKDRISDDDGVLITFYKNPHWLLKDLPSF